MPRVAYLVNDLLFTSKIRETAQQLGVEAVAIRDLGSLTATAAGAALFILDLRRPDALAVLDSLAADSATQAMTKVGFVDHERADVMEAARERGCMALAKGKFSTELVRLLSTL